LNKRKSWDEYFIDLLEPLSERATCDRGKTAVIIVINNEIVSTGYVGSPSELPHCDDVGHLMHRVINELDEESQHCVRTNHGEMNAIAQAAKNGKATKGGTLYCKMTPCYTCAKMLIQIGIKRIVAKKRYHADQLSMDLFKQAGIEVNILKDEVVKYEKQ